MMMKMANIPWILKLIFIVALTSKSGEESTSGIKSLHSMIGMFSHSKGTIWRTTGTNWTIKLTLGITCLASSSNGIDGLDFIVNRPQLHSVIVVITNQEMIGGGLNAKACWIVELTKIGSIGANRQEMGQIMLTKELEAMIPLIRNNDSLILGVKGDSVRTTEFSICRAKFSSTKSQLLIQWSLFEWL